MICPNCGKDDKRVLLQDQTSYKKCHHFICGHCKLEFDLQYTKTMPINLQLATACKAIVVFEFEDDIEEKVSKMSHDEMLARLKELDKKPK